MFIYIFAVIFCIGSVSSGIHRPTVELALGKIIGHHKSSFDGRTFSAFEGIPYAKPPIGDLRFEEPKPANPWNGVLNATTSYICTQIAMDFRSVIGEEDCLYLNVYVPKMQPSQSDNFDVVVHIHGGGFMIGSGAVAGPYYIMDRNVIYVNFNYRLGLLGFLSTEDDVVPGNNGLKDQQLALKWIQSHIRQFGGNPHSVTLVGLSSGGSCVQFHYLSQHSKGLFHRGISHSGTALAPFAIQEGGLEKTKKLGVEVNCHDSATHDIINCMRKVVAKELVAKTTHFYGFSNFPIAPFAPVVEKNSTAAFIVESPYILLQSGRINDAPWMVSVTKDEGMFGAQLLIGKLEELDQNWSTMAPFLLDCNYTLEELHKEKILSQIKELYFNKEKISESRFDLIFKLMGDRFFHVPFENSIRMQSKVSKSPIYAYVYSFEGIPAMGTITGLDFKGVSHGADGFLMYEIFIYGQSFAQKTLPPSDHFIKDVLLDLVTSFARDGKPKLRNIRWEPATDEHFTYLSIDDVDKIEMVENNKFSPAKFWESLNLQKQR